MIAFGIHFLLLITMDKRTKSDGLSKSIKAIPSLKKEPENIDDFSKNFRAELEQKVAEFTTQLENTNIELESFTYSVSHDLKAPLRAINGYAKILQEEYATKLDDDGVSSLNAILRNSEKMAVLIDNLLAYSRLGRKIVSVSEINMNSLVKSVINEIKVEEVAKTEFTLSVLFPANGQQALIKQVWVSLISNALKFSRNNSKVKIEIGSYAKDDLIVYFIKDNGVGFNMHYYSKLFGVFQRLHLQEEFEGTGISLAIVKKIVNNHNGSVWAESELNKGSCFYFSLPSIKS
jgi:light-regulated signal transduction histidine kinase (bacteriophytochrome)